MANIKLLISDFDGTLVNTFVSNFNAYKDAFSNSGLSLTEQQYRECFGLRFDDFMAKLGITDCDIKATIRCYKNQIYPTYFSLLKINATLLKLIRSFKASGGYVSLASTARRENLINAIQYLGIADIFDYIIAGEDVIKAKPNPEIYLKVLEHFSISSKEALVFEDSDFGFAAAEAANINYIKVTKKYYNGY